MSVDSGTGNMGPHMASAVTEAEYLWAAYQHTLVCDDCFWGCRTTTGCASCHYRCVNERACHVGRLFCAEIRRQGWDIRNTPLRQPERKPS